jgi:hypothetical protein
MTHSGLREPDLVQLRDPRGFILPSCAEGKIFPIKNPDNYLEKYYTAFSQGK